MSEEKTEFVYNGPIPVLFRPTVRLTLEDLAEVVQAQGIVYDGKKLPEHIQPHFQIDHAKLQQAQVQAKAEWDKAQKDSEPTDSKAAAA